MHARPNHRSKSRCFGFACLAHAQLAHHVTPECARKPYLLPVVSSRRSAGQCGRQSIATRIIRIVLATLHAEIHNPRSNDWSFCDIFIIMTIHCGRRGKRKKKEGKSPRSAATVLCCRCHAFGTPFATSPKRDIVLTV